MSCGHRFRIVSTLLGVAVCAPIAALPALSQPRAIVFLLATESDSTPINTTEAAIESAELEITDRTILSCHSAYPIFCIYTNQNLVNHLRQDAWATDVSTELQQDSAANDEIVDSSDRATAVNLERKIRLLTQLKTWLDAIS